MFVITYTKQSHQVVTGYFSYIYSEEAKLTEANVSEVMYLGRKYMLDGLLQECLSFLDRYMSTDNVCAILNEAIKFQEEAIIDTTLKFIQNNVQEVLNAKGFHDLSQQALEMFLKQERSIDECRVLEIVLKWAKKRLETEQKHNLRDVLGNCIYHIKYANLTVDQFACYLGNSSMLTEEERCLFFCYLARGEETNRTRLTDLGYHVPQKQSENSQRKFVYFRYKRENGK